MTPSFGKRINYCAEASVLDAVFCKTMPGEHEHNADNAERAERLAEHEYTHERFHHGSLLARIDTVPLLQPCSASEKNR